MKKTLTANISGIVFHIDEDAYDKLNLYLKNVRQYFTPDEGCDEILSDIETRIAEMLQDKTSTRQVVTLDDINEVISQLGDPSQIRGDESAEEPMGSPTYIKTQKRLYRDPDNKYLGGVAGGLGAYFNIDPTWLRVAFVVFTFVYGFGPLVYIILWIVVPRAVTTAEKLEMRGERVTITNIERSIREELGDLKKNIEDFSNGTRKGQKKKDNRNNLEEALEDIGQALASVFTVLFRVIGALIGVGFIFLGLFLLIGLISSLFWGPIPVTFPFDDAPLFSILALLEMIFTAPWMINLAIAGLLLALGIPLVALIYSGLRLIFGFESRIRYFGAVTLTLWVAGIAICAFMAVHGVRNFSAEHTLSDQYPLETPDSPNLYLEVNEDARFERTGLDRMDRHNEDFYWLSLAREGTGRPRLRIRSTQSDTITLTITRESRGATYTEARQMTQGITYSYNQQDSVIVFDPVFSWEQEDRWRGQQLYLELNVPEDKVVILSPTLKRILNVRWGSSSRVRGHVYIHDRNQRADNLGEGPFNHHAIPGGILSLMARGF
ncbi:MAG: PspC domain-containing protein [Bacteroidales bacterium]